ncbi:hypothetical protein [Amycolatopsis anabasis]|uniref:hypothetical protein n=1 Tax=Amycolatopsis anabasis TaxID=1840409 RepID=UPI00131EA9E4|nr:hypothetical protein [Amycolatopsis anabasis]
MPERKREPVQLDFVPPETVGLCPHNRMPEQCEDCALVQAAERGYRPPEVPQASTPDTVRADTDMYVETGEPDTYVFIRAGESIPRQLEGNRRHKAQ